MTVAAARTPLVATLWPSHSQSILHSLLLVAAGTALLTLSAKIQVPFYPVPMTMQTFVVLVLGMAYGSRLGAATVLAYLAQGAGGLPVFAAGGGLAYLTGPTGGFLVGFVAAAWLVGQLAERGWDRNWIGAAVAMTLGHAVIFLVGLAWLAQLIGAEEAYAKGLAPFWAATALKTALGVAVMPVAWKLVDRVRRT